jgi:hypothetical protein
MLDGISQSVSCKMFGIQHRLRMLVRDGRAAQETLQRLPTQLSRRGSAIDVMIRKLKSGGYRLYSRKLNPATGKRRNLGTFTTLAAAARHERQVQYFKRKG